MQATNVDKQELIDWIRDLNNQETLRHIKFLKDNQRIPRWKDLPKSAKASIERGLQDSKAGRVHSHEEVRKIYEQWL